MFRSRVTALAVRFMRDTGGATAIEYAVMASGIGCAVISVVFALGSGIKATLYDRIAGAFN